MEVEGTPWTVPERLCFSGGTSLMRPRYFELFFFNSSGELVFEVAP